MKRMILLGACAALTSCNLFTSTESTFDSDVPSDSDQGSSSSDMSATADMGGDAGSVGDGGTTIPDMVVDPDMPTGPGDFWVDVTVGEEHSCALASDGRAFCWGEGGNGRLGSGSEEPRTTPTEVLGGRSFVDLDAGGRHTCALDTEGALYCWGVGEHIGAPQTADQFAPFLVDTGPFQQLSAGHDDVCVIDDDGFAKCLGANDAGQLGVAGPESRSSLVDLGGSPLQATDVVAGYEVTCAISNDAVTCWGRDLAAEEDDDMATLFNTQVVTTPTPLVDIDFGWTHGCGVDAIGDTYCWGAAPLIEALTVGGTATAAGPVDVPLAFASSVSGAEFSCGLTSDGSPTCWGSNYRGRQGKGTDNSGGTPEPPEAMATTAKFRAMDIASYHGCAITTDDTLLCWGQAFDGRLGNGQAGWQDEPVAVDSNEKFISVAAGDYHACGVTDTNVMMCWGRGSYNALGLGSTDHKPVPAAIPGIQFKSTVAGGSHTCGLTTGNVGYCWGSDNDGVLGNGAAGTTNTPAIIVDSGTFSTLDTGANHSCGVYTAGTAACWGYLYDIGTDVGSDQHSPIELDTTPPRPHPNYVTLSSGWRHTCGLDASGEAFCFGENEEGQLGDDSTTYSRYESVSVAGSLLWKSIDVGEQWTCGITTSDALYCWGYGYRVGDGGTSDDHVPKQIMPTTNWQSVAAGNDSTCAITANGDVMCWGQGSRGRLGHGSTAGSYAPVSAVLGEPGTAVAVGGSHACAIGQSGQMYCWGSEEFGRLGTGIDSIHREPVPVVVDGIQ